MTIRVLIADDQPIVRSGLTMLLDAQPDIEVVGAVADGREAVRLARALRPDDRHLLRHQAWRSISDTAQFTHGCLHNDLR